MARILVDSNVIIDVLNEKSSWHEWSAEQLALASETYAPVINPVVFAEISYRYSRLEEAQHALSVMHIDKVALPFEAAWLAAQCHRKYRIQGGIRTMILPDFFIGAHAMADGLTLLTRDKARYATYFPTVALLCP